MSSLQARLQNPDYINWVKAGLCLIHTKVGLDDFADTASQSLHQSILTNIIPAFANTAQPLCGISIRRHNLITTCAHPYCQGFLAAVINNGIDPTHTFTVRPGNLSNCDVITVGQWHTHHWQVAKLFMNQGQLPTQVNPSETDMSGIINFLSHCKVPRNMMTNVLLLDKVRRARNGIMHTADMKLSNADLHTYSTAMTDLLNDPGIACFPTAQLALADIQSIINAAEFRITLEDESKVMDELAVEIRAMTEGMKYKLETFAECGEADRQAIKEQLNEEIKKVASLYEVLKGEVMTSTGTQKQMEDKITSLKDQLGRVTEDLRSFDTKLGDIERQQHELAKQQEAFSIETKQAIAEVKAKQGQTHERLDELANTNARKYSNPLNEDAKERLCQYMQSTYKDHLHVTPLSDWDSLNVPDIFTPVVLIGDLIGDNKETLESYKDLFYKEGVLQKKIILLGKAGTGKTTFCKHLADIWCNPTSKRQFDDVDVLQQFQFLFYVSFRFAEKHETVLEMIQNQLFDDEEMQAIACHVLKHNSDSCLILMDGFDEYQRQTLAKTGKRGDITGFPSLKSVQDCILLVTSRPWKFYYLPKEDRKIFSTMELDGIKDSEELIEVILTKLEEPDPAKSCSDFKAQIENNNMTEIMKSPLMLIFAIDIWVSERSLPKSICINYIKIIESFVCRYQTKREEVITENTEVCVKKLVDKDSESAKLLPHILSNYEFVQMHAGLFLSLGHLASDFLIGQEKQSLVFQKEACKRYNIKENDGSLKLCLDLGILTKLESIMRGIKRTESFQFCHKTFQEFFAALWLSRKYTKEDSQERLTLHSRIETKDDLLNHGVLIQCMCGLNPELGSDFWKYIAQENIIQYRTVNEVQNLILKAVKEAHNCCDTQREHLYYCISHVRIHKQTSDEDVSMLCKMIQNNSTYLKSLEMIFQEQICLSYSQYHSLMSSISGATNLTTLTLRSISCQTNVSSDCLPVLYLHKHHKLWRLELDNISVSDLILPSQEESQLSELHLDNLVLSNDNLVQLCASLSSLTVLHDLKLTNISCSDNSLNLGLPVLDLHRHHRLRWLKLKKISISGLLLPSQEESELFYQYLEYLVLSNDNCVQLCSSLSSLTGLCVLKLTNISCSDNSLNLGLPVLDLHRHHRLTALTLDKISISGLLLPSQEQSELWILYMDKLVLSHDNLVQLCSSLSSLTDLHKLVLTNISLSDDSLNLGRPVLDLHRHSRIEELSLNKISISGLLLPSQEESKLKGLYLENLVLSHDNLVQLYTSLSCVTTYLEVLGLTNLTCSDHDGSCHLLLDLHRHVNLSRLRLNKISLSALLLPIQKEPKLERLELNNMLLSHDSLVQLCSSISSLSALKWLQLTNLRCYDHDGSGDIPILDFPKQALEDRDLEEIQVEDLQALSGIEDLQLTVMPSSENSGECIFTVLDLHKHYQLEELKLDSSSISGIILPRQERLRFERLIIKNLLLSHYSLEQLCAPLSSFSALNVKLHFTKLSCRDHDGGYCFPLLNQPDTELNVTDTDSEMDSSDDDSDSDDSLLVWLIDI